MDWITCLLTITHAAAAGAGALSMRWWIVRKVRVREIDGHTALEFLPLREDDDR